MKMCRVRLEGEMTLTKSNIFSGHIFPAERLSNIRAVLAPTHDVRGWNGNVQGVSNDQVVLVPP